MYELNKEVHLAYKVVVNNRTIQQIEQFNNKTINFIFAITF